MLAPPDLNSGDILTAAWLTSLVRTARRLLFRAANFTYPLRYDEAANVLTLDLTPEFVFKITSGSQPYAGTQQKDVAGVWSDVTGGLHPTTVADPLFERNGNKSVRVGTLVLAKRDRTSKLWVFGIGSCVVPTGVPNAPNTTHVFSSPVNPPWPPPGTISTPIAVLPGTVSGLPVGALPVPTPP